MAEHTFILLEHPELGEIEIDVEIAPVIEHLWREGIGTRFCCQGDKYTMAQIIFCGSEDASRFLKLYERVLCPPHWFNHSGDLWVLNRAIATTIREHDEWLVQIEVTWPHELTPDLVALYGESSPESQPNGNPGTPNS